MPITVFINRDRRLVHAVAAEVISNADLMAYQEDTWFKGNVSGYDGIFDGTLADFSQVSFTGMLALSQNAVKVDLGGPPSKLAIVVGSEHMVQLSEFYRTATDALPGSSRTTKIFHTFEDAYTWVVSDAS